MAGDGKAYDLDMRHVEDEPLVCLARECGYVPAALELKERYVLLARRHVRTLSRQRRLRSEHTADACQESYFWFREAVDRYSLDEMGRPRGRTFRSFLLHVVIADRFSDFCRRAAKIDMRMHERVDMDGNLVADGCYLRVCAGVEQGIDEPHAIDIRDQVERLRQVVAELPARLRLVVEDLLVHCPRKTTAARLGVSEDAVKRLRAKALITLATRMRRH